ncbi:uncharacterized protein LOC129284350 [Prosopis cineraria]|uniref:uncharacterized protein LOC129284350 n=1 Tax=Prosopis cineraria TaxID=364024 RepID=UPI00240F830A|nr:uncharacterized protein LOC129284350 [Prosopis cineraria]
MENQNPSSKPPKATPWDCGSTLYDSFELNSFKRQLDSAIANSARSLSMPHISDRRLPPPPPLPPTMSKKPFKISRSLHKFLRSVFKLNHNHNHNLHKSSSVNSSSSSFEVPQKSRERFFVVYDKSVPVLSSIPELPEFEIPKVSPDITSLVKRSASDRFTPTTIGISCA